MENRNEKIFLKNESVKYIINKEELPEKKPLKKSKINKNNNNDKYINKKYIPLIFTTILIFFLILFIFRKVNIQFKKDEIKKLNSNKGPIEVKEPDKNKVSNNNYCYIPLDNSNIKIIHLIITRFFMKFKDLDFEKIMSTEEYAQNAIRVTKKYLLPSLENQSCKKFIWILMIGNYTNITYVKSLFNFNNSFQTEVIYKKDMKNYMRNITLGYDILITTRIDYDDAIYYDAVNDVRKEIDINKPILLHGYNKGVYYFESEDKYYDYYNNFDNKGVMSIFISFITVLNKVNDTYSVYELGDHTLIKKHLLEAYKSFGVGELNYELTKFDISSPKFIYVRQKYSGGYDYTSRIPKKLNPIYFNLSEFYGK